MFQSRVRSRGSSSTCFGFERVETVTHSRSARPSVRTIAVSLLADHPHLDREPALSLAQHLNSGRPPLRTTDLTVLTV